MSVINELPVWLPWFNLALSTVAAALLIPVVARRRQFPQTRRWWLAVDIVLAVAIMVLIAGAAFQSTILSLDHWTILGTGGRAIICLFLLALLTVAPDRPADG